jgi:hypothetical protein
MLMPCISCGENIAQRSKWYCSNSGHLRRYLFEKYDNACSCCGWKKINSFTGKIPLEVDHIDGNSNNNIESNLRLLCPNCHSLTPNFRNLNKGMGMKWRRQKYLRSA